MESTLRSLCPCVFISSLRYFGWLTLRIDCPGLQNCWHLFILSQNKNPDMAEISNAEKWVLYLSAFDFSATIDLAMMTKRGNPHRVDCTDWSSPNDELPIYDHN